MKTLAFLMIVAGAVIGTGAVMEFAYFGPGTPQFTVGVFTTPAGFGFLVAGVDLWRRGVQARSVVASAALVLLLATTGAGVLNVMGPAAILVSVFAIACCGAWLVLLQRRGRPATRP